VEKSAGEADCRLLERHHLQAMTSRTGGREARAAHRKAAVDNQGGSTDNRHDYPFSAQIAVLNASAGDPPRSPSSGHRDAQRLQSCRLTHRRDSKCRFRSQLCLGEPRHVRRNAYEPGPS
jgi:hypothetical protein